MLTIVQACRSLRQRWLMICVLLLFAGTGFSVQNGNAQGTHLLSVSDKKLDSTTYLSSLHVGEDNLQKLTKKISLSFKETGIKHILQFIAGEADIKLAYSSLASSLENEISIRANEITVLEALFETVKGTDLRFKLTESGQLIVTKDDALLLNDVVSKPISIQVISGIVTSSENGFALPGANVIIQETFQGAATDRDGRFALPRVKPGTYTVVASYIGYETQMKQVTIEGTQPVVLNFELTLTPFQGDEVLVLGYRAEGQAKALTQQKNAANITNIVASDQIGRFPDASAPDALQRVPGVGVQRDQGEGRFIQIRGGAPQLTTVMFNGERIPSPEGDVRQIALDAIPVEILESIEVSKAITPDMDADAIGGAVNLVTRRAPARQMFHADFGGGYGSVRDQGSVKSSLSYGNRVSNGKFGYLINGSFNRRNFGSDNIEPEYDFGDDDAPLGGDDALEELQVRYYDVLRQRTGINSVFDYEFSDRSSLYVRGLFVNLQDTEQRHRLRNKVGDDELGYEHKNRTEYLRTFGVTLGGEQRTQSGVKIDYHVGITRSEEDTPEDVEIVWEQGDVTFDPIINDPDNIRANPLDGALQNTSAFEFDAIEPSESNTTNDDYVGAININLPYDVGSSVGQLKFGAKFRYKDKKQDVTEGAFELTDDASDILLGVGNGVSFSGRYNASDFEAGSYALPPIITGNEEVLDFIEAFSSALELDDGALLEGNLEDFEATEQTLAAYVMTELNLSPNFLVLPGIRWEQTNVESVGFQSVVTEENDEGDLATDLEDLERVEAENDYGYLFPMLHLRYKASPQTNIRAALTTALARPNFFDLAPYEIRDDDELVLGNPTLDPSRSLNLDLFLEHYTSSIGVIAGGVFYKQIEDPIVTFREESDVFVDGEAFELTQFQSRNGDSGYIWGVELAVQQQLRFLPGALSGLGIYANYTYTESEAKLSDGSTNVFPGQANHIFNFALSYEKGGFSGQVSLNHTGEFLDEFAGDGVSASRANDIFVQERWGLDISASYQFTSGVSTFVELLNLLNEPLELYQGNQARPIQREFYRPWGWIGVKYNM